MTDELKSELLMELTAVLDDGQEIGETPHGNRRIVYLTGGEFEGPKLKGQVLPGGGDWLLMRPDGAGELDVRATLQTDDGHLIYSSYRGVFHGGADGKDFYFRVTPYYETASEKYGWLNRIVAVGVGTFAPPRVTYNVYEIL